MLLIPPVFIDGNVLHLQGCSGAASARLLSERSLEDVRLFHEEILEKRVKGCLCLGADTLKALTGFLYEVEFLQDVTGLDLDLLSLDDVYLLSEKIDMVIELHEEGVPFLKSLLVSTPFASWADGLGERLESFISRALGLETSPRVQEMILGELGVPADTPRVWAVRPMSDLSDGALVHARVFSKGHFGDRILVLAPVAVLEDGDEMHTWFDRQYYSYLEASELTKEQEEIALNFFASGNYSSFVECVEVAHAITG